MAKAERVDKEEVVNWDEPYLNLTLSRREVLALRMIFHKTGGSPSNTLRGTTDNLDSVLSNFIHINASEVRKLIDGGVTFKEGDFTKAGRLIVD